MRTGGVWGFCSIHRLFEVVFENWQEGKRGRLMLSAIAVPKDEYLASNQNGGLWVLLGALVLIAVMVIYVFTHKPKWKDDDQEGNAPVSQPEVRLATAEEKEIQRIETGTIRSPSHHFLFQVKFRFEDSSEIWLSVPEEYYHQIPLHTWEKLITLNQQFWDLAGLENTWNRRRETK